MYKSLYILSLVLFILASCSKTKQTNKKIDGEWEIISYRTTSTSGLTHYYDATGTITFGASSDTSFTYAENYTVEGTSGPQLFQRQGIGTYLNELGLDHKLDILSPAIETLSECTFKLVTKDDLKIEQRDNSFTYTIVLKND